MPEPTYITERLEASAEVASPAVAAELNAAASKIGSYSRAPGKRAEADRIATVLTTAVVEALGDAFVGVREEELADPPHPLIGCEFQQADYAFAALLIASATPALAAAATPPLTRVRELVDRMLPKQAEHVQYLAGLYPEAPMSEELRAATAARLGQEPETVGARWARLVGLDLPAEFWWIGLTVPCTTENGRLDADVHLDVGHTPGSDARWSVRLGSMNTNSLGGNQSPSWPDSEHGTYERVGRASEIRGHIEPAADPIDLPRVLRDLEAAHPELRFDRDALSVQGKPGRLISPTKKKRLIAWLSSANGD